VGLRDGTGYGVRNVNLYKTIGLNIPPAVSLTPNSNATLIESTDLDLSSALKDLGKLTESVNDRIGKLSLRDPAVADGVAFACGGSSSPAPPLTLMVGRRDGTGCGVMNYDYRKKLEIVAP
jgi:hypothetical protein